jgi:hypothetical protein
VELCSNNWNETWALYPKHSLKSVGVQCILTRQNFSIFVLSHSLPTRLDKKVLLLNTGSILVSWYSKELSSWYLEKLRYKVDVYLISIWCLHLFDHFLMFQSWKIKVKKSLNRWLLFIYLKCLVWSGVMQIILKFGILSLFLPFDCKYFDNLVCFEILWKT